MRLRDFAPVALIALMGVMAACGRQQHLLDTVPADAGMVVVLDAEKLTGYMDGKAYGGTLDADGVLDRFLVRATGRSRNEVKTLLTTDAINRHSLVMFSSKGDDVSVISSMKRGDCFYTFEINNLERLVAQLGAGAPENVDGFDAYRLEGAVMLVRDRQGWIAEGDASSAAKALAAQLAVAANSPLSSQKGVASHLTGDDGFMRSIVSMANTGEQGWVCADVAIDDTGRQLEVDAEYLGADGKKAYMDKYLKDIDTKLLRYATPSDMFVMAAGIRPDTDWEGLFNYLQAIYPMSSHQRSAMAVAFPYLKRLDGTLLVAAGVTVDDRLSRAVIASDINFVVAIQVDKSRAKDTMKDFAGLVSLTGVPMIEKDGEYFIQAKGMPPVTMKLVDSSTIVIANRNLDQLGNEAAAKVMKGNSLGVWANVPNSTGEAVYGGRGFRLTMELDGGFESEFALNGSTMPLLEQLAGIVAAGTDERAVTEDVASDTAEGMGFVPLDTIR